MSQPNPSATADGEEQRLPTNAEDRKAAAALSSLNDNEIGDTSNNNSTNKLSSADAQEALGKAMSRLEIAAGGGGGGKPGAANNKVAGEKAGAAQVEKKKAVKVAAEDVTLLVRVFLFFFLFICVSREEGRGLWLMNDDGRSWCGIGRTT